MQKIFDKIIPYTQYQENLRPTPDIYKWRNETQQLFFFGIEHTHDWKDKQLKKLRTSFQTFINETESKKRLIIIEEKIPSIEKNVKLAIKNNKESGLMVLLAKEWNIVISSVEPTPDQIIYIAKECGAISDIELILWMFFHALSFGNKKIFLSSICFLDQTIGFHVFNPKIYQQAIKFSLTEESIRNLFDMIDSFYVPELQSLLYKMKVNFIFPEKTARSFLSKKYIKIAKKLQDPFIQRFRTNEIGTILNRSRDALIAKGILLKLKTGKNIFVVHGKIHAFTQAPIFNNYF